ncbi:N-6 DNA Methylase domain protein [Leptospira weilii serovar Topaz str. LT2116]|uniref:site-specific DNA-methyltransferase (adenine-specific) n=1 Tax=Leptospira weilii serovar Topaz str. LT2116 TaxID=1088540 RepID=M3GTY6_9LEPT|nr:N-6 DNA Methylase domain protein [Leptospira weilii serovar Topaz str. LT2116]
MQNAVFIIPKASLLWEAIQIIESIFLEIERDTNEGGQTFQDVQGDVYEMLLGEIATAGKNGQFRTPRHIIKLIAELVAPRLGQSGRSGLWHRWFLTRRLSVYAYRLYPKKGFEKDRS